MPACPSCGLENPEGFRGCGGCGAQLAAPTDPVEERRVVTVLFADLVGFTSKAEQLRDPEDVRRMLEPYYARLRHELVKVGGLVEKFIGDAVMAIFGAPVAHEDDPERAVRAALAIRQAIAELSEGASEPELSVRIGINTGEALWALDVAHYEGERLVADFVNVAARLQAAAPVNGILVGETTYRATARAIEYRAFEPVKAKGKEDPVLAWEAVGSRTRVGVDPYERGRVPLVGRSHEVQLLCDAFSRVRREHSVQLVTLVGPPGIGKSRLVFELQSVVEDDPELVYWRRGACLPYGDGVSFWPLAEMVKAQAGILETDSAEQVSGKLASAVEDLIERDDEARWVGEHLGRLLGSSRSDTGGKRPRRGLRGVAPLPRDDGRRPADRAHLRGPPLGGRGPPRLHRPSRRLGGRGPAPRGLHRTAGAARSALGLGRRQAERGHRLALAPLGRGDVAAPLRAARAGGHAGRSADEAAGARRRQPPLRGGVRPHARRARHGARRRPPAPRVRAGDHRGPPRRPSGRGEGRAPGRGRGRPALLDRSPRAHRRPVALGPRGPAPLPRAEAVRPPPAPLGGRGRDGVRVPPPAGRRRRLRAHPASAPGREAPPRGRVARDDRAPGGSGGDAGSSLRERPRARAGRRAAPAPTSRNAPGSR